jgi:epoxyqueuosine reductase
VGAAATALVDELRTIAVEAGLDALGVASAEPFASTRHDLESRRSGGLHGGMHFTFGDPARATDPSATLPGARSLVVGALGYRGADPLRPSGRGPVARVARYARADHYRVLRDGLARVAVRLERDGWRAVVLVDDNRLVDREAAYRAGIGWYGKNTNLLLPGRGSWFVLGSVVTDAPLPAAEPIADGCGGCRRCLPACPTGALVAPGVLDARRCLAHLVQAPGTFPREYRAALGDRLYGCDDCQEVCPPNRLEARADADERDANTRDDDAWVPVLDVLARTDDELLARYGRWYIPRRQPRYLRRNALVVLGNVGDGADPDVEAALTRALADDDPLVRAHAAWAARRLGRDDLVAHALAGESEPEVLAELA